MTFMFDPDEAGKLASANAKAAKAANQETEISNFSKFSSNDRPLPDPAMEARRQAVLSQLRDHPNVIRAVQVDDPDTDPVLVAVAIRGVGSFELKIPKAKFDAERFMGLVDKHSAQPIKTEAA